MQELETDTTVRVDETGKREANPGKQAKSEKENPLVITWTMIWPTQQAEPLTD